MQPWLQPMQVVTGSPAIVFRTSPGSAIIARVIPTASHTPSPISRSASAGSRIRPVAITGTAPTRAFTRAAKSAIAFRGAGGGGTIHVDPRYVDEPPKATER